MTQLPAPGDTVGVDSTVSVVFGADPDPATLSEAGFTVSDFAGTLPGVLDYDAGTRTWTWTPTRQLPRGAMLTARIGRAVGTIDGAVVADGFAWSFRVRAGEPGTTATIATNVPWNGSDPVLAAFLRDGRPLVAIGQLAWTVGQGGPDPAEPLLGGRARGLCVDAAGNAVALMSDSVGAHAALQAVRRQEAGNWSQPEWIADTGSATLLDYGGFLGNDAGHLLVHQRVQAASLVVDRAFWCAPSGAAPGTWQALPLPDSRLAYELRAGLDGFGRVVTLHSDGTYVIVQQQEPGLLGVRENVLAQVPGTRIAGLGVDDGGTIRAVWTEIGQVTRQRRSVSGLAFGPETTQPIVVPSNVRTLTAPTGAMRAWRDRDVYRSEGASDVWVAGELEQLPVALALSPRGEAAMLIFELPDVWSLVRWQPNEGLTAPIQIAAVPSPVSAPRDGGLAFDAVGRVYVAFRPDSSGELYGVLVE
ncbi:MAG: hypothetical protein KDE27_06545 [Planctomycetes bacterium]|nr:hypothetical protein [Planctomycetota bacterium]